MNYPVQCVDCQRCALAERDDRRLAVGCTIGETPRRGCLAKIQQRPEEKCSKCEEITSDWDWFGPKETRYRVCRDCMCPTYDLTVNSPQESNLSRVSGE